MIRYPDHGTCLFFGYKTPGKLIKKHGKKITGCELCHTYLLKLKFGTFVRESQVSMQYYISYMKKNSEMRKLWWVSREQLSQERGEILLFHNFPVLDINNLRHRWHNTMRFFCKTHWLFRFSFFQKLFPFTTCEPFVRFCDHPSPQFITMIPSGWSPSNLLPFPQHNYRPYSTGSFLISSKHRCHFLFLLSFPPLTSTLQLLCLSCSALNLDSSLQLMSAIPRSSPKRLQRMVMALCCSLPWSCRLDTCIPPLCPSVSLSPPVLRTATMGMFSPLWDMRLCFILHAALGLLLVCSLLPPALLPGTLMSPTFWLLVLFHLLQASH